MNQKPLRRCLCVALAVSVAACSQAQPTPGDAPEDTARAKLHLNDVSILFPIPAWQDRDELLSATTRGARGQLLPRAVAAHLPPLLGTTPEEDETYPTLRAVSARIDPCFPGKASPEQPCRRQLRLVMQPLVSPFEGVVETEDAAVHLFYDLDEGEFKGLLEDLLALKPLAPESTATAPLGVHPTLKAQGMSGELATELRRALLRRIGEQNLTQMAFMQLTGRRRVWNFGRFDIREGAVVAVDIPDVDEALQTFTNVTLSLEDFDATTSPEMHPKDDVSVFFRSENARMAPRDAIEGGYAAALRIENPDHHGPESINCVSCHVATGARLWAERNYELTADEHPDRFRSAHDLTLMSEVTENTSSLRAFGYFGTQVAISQRTVNETAAVVDELAARYLDAPGR